MTSLEAMIILNMIKDIGPIRAKKLLEEFGEPEKIFQASRDRLSRIKGMDHKGIESILTWEKQVNLAREIALCESHNCQVISTLDDDYPKLLREIYDPPIVLYIKGKMIEPDHRGVTIVGSRRTTHYGRETARRLSQQLGQAGVTVISGGARGIDSNAHLGSLHVKGRTLCVFGNGINITYPRENEELFDRIAANGAIITQFPFNHHASRYTFPLRNRIVAGMTLGSVVVEANARSGALITANLANDYGRQVFAVPGPIHSPMSKGCHTLIKNGAKLCESVDDILSEIESMFPAAATPAELSIKGLDETERSIVEIIRDGDVHIDEIVRRTNSSVASVSVILLKLEMKRLIRQQPGHIYSAAN